jgi:tetratricopeptide (TPR) repeat protein
VSLKRMRKSLEQLRTWMPEAEQPLQQLAVLERDGRMLIRLAEGALAAPDGQLELDFDHAPDVDQAEDDGGADVGPCLRICAGDEQAMSQRHRTPVDWFDLAVEQQSAGLLDEAAASFREALLAGGPDAQTCFDLAGVLHALGRREQAIERYRQAVEIDPRFADAWNNLGTLLAEAGQLDDACAAFRRAIAIDANDSRAHYNLADTLDEMGLPREAAPHWKAFLRHDTASPWAAHARKRLAMA